MGGTREAASELAGHELQHALAHNGPGYMGIESNDIFVVGFYRPDGELTKEENKKIALAVGEKNMSHQDKKHIK